MQTNNFDSSSSGVNLELSVFLDGETSRNDFEEAFHVIQYSGYRTNCKLFYTDFGQVEFTGSLLDYFKLPENIDSKELFLKWIEFSGSNPKGELEDLKYHAGFYSVREKSCRTSLLPQ